MRRLVLSLACLVAAAVPEPAGAVEVKLGLGANYWLIRAGLFDLDLSLTVPLARVIAVGGRFGVAMVTSPTNVGIPLDLVLEIRPLGRMYIDVVGGPWLLFGHGATVLGHFAVGLGLRVGAVSFGPEVGYLEPDGIIGMRLGISL